MAERWTIVATDLKGDKSLVEIRHSDGTVFINPDMTDEESKHAIAQLAKRVLILSQTLAVR